MIDIGSLRAFEGISNRDFRYCVIIRIYDC